MEFAQDTSKFAEMMKGITESVVQLSLNMITEELKYCGKLFVAIKYHSSIKSKECMYLLDYIMNMQLHIGEFAVCVMQVTMQ